MDGGVKVSVVGGFYGFVKCGGFHRLKRFTDGFARRSIDAGIQQVHQAAAQSGVCLRTAADKRIERGSLAGGVYCGRKTYEKTCAT